MNLLGSLAISLLTTIGCASPPPAEQEPAVAPLVLDEPPVPKPEEPKPGPKEDPKPEPIPEEPRPAPVKEEPKPEPKMEEPPPPPPPKTSPEAKELLAKAAERQGTAALVGPLAPTRFLAKFATVLVHSEKGDRAEFTDSSEAFALPVPGGKEARMRSEAILDHKKVVLGHNGRFGWMWTKDLKTHEEETRRFTDREKDAEDIKDIDGRRRMLRLALRVFFLGEMGEGPIPVKVLPDEEKTIPVGHEGKTKVVRCRVLERAADPASGEPALRILLDAKTLNPVGIVLLPPKAEEPSFLLTVDFDADAIRAKKAYPAGIRVPDWVELFEVGETAAIRIQAGLVGLEIDPTKFPDTIFEAPRK